MSDAAAAPAQPAAADDAARRYFAAMRAALAGLRLFMDERLARAPDLAAEAIAEHATRLERSFSCWENRLGFTETFRISRAESGFPVFQHVLELENDRRTAAQRLAALPEADAIRADMADFILRRKEFPAALKRSMAERLYLEDVANGQTFGPFSLAKTVYVSVSPKTVRPVCVVHWASFDGVAHLPLIYVLTVEDSSPALVEQIVGEDGRLREDVPIPLPVDGLLNPELAHRFDDFTEKNSAFSLSPATIATNLDKDFPTLHPKQLRRVVLGPFYGAGLTEHGSRVATVLSKVRRAESAWLLTWTVQEVFSIAERAGKQGLWSSEPPTQEFHIETADLEAARQGVSAYERHALVPHEAYQALYAAGEAKDVFAGFRVHVLSKGGVITDE